MGGTGANPGEGSTRFLVLSHLTEQLAEEHGEFGTRLVRVGKLFDEAPQVAESFAKLPLYITHLTQPLLDIRHVGGLLRHLRIKRLRGGCLVMIGSVFSLQKAQVQGSVGRLESIPQCTA
jgi:hypothetical protein